MELRRVFLSNFNIRCFFLVVESCCYLGSCEDFFNIVIFFVAQVKNSSTFAPALRETLKNVVKEI
jgi:hypothetical protein